MSRNVLPRLLAWFGLASLALSLAAGCREAPAPRGPDLDRSMSAVEKKLAGGKDQQALCIEYMRLCEAGIGLCLDSSFAAAYSTFCSTLQQRCNDNVGLYCVGPPDGGVSGADAAVPAGDAAVQPDATSSPQPDAAGPPTPDAGPPPDATPPSPPAIKPPQGYSKLLFHDEFSGPLSIGTQAGTTWAPGWITWNTRHLAGNSDDCWKQHDGEHGWTSSWQDSGRSIGDALRSDPGFVAAHGKGPYNHEVSNGTLKLRALRVPSKLRNSDFGGFEFTGGMISTEDRFSFKHGWMEIRLRFNKVAQGMHFGFWTLSQDKKSWQDNYGPEYDPLEVLSRDPSKGMERPKHWHQNAIGIPTQPGQTGYPWTFYKVVSDYDKWHTVALERGTDDKARFYIDGVLTREEDVSSKPQYRDEKHYLLCTWEIGGNWPGEVTSTDPYWYVEVEIDYVRVFGK